MSPTWWLLINNNPVFSKMYQLLAEVYLTVIGNMTSMNRYLRYVMASVHGGTTKRFTFEKTKSDAYRLSEVSAEED